MLYSMRIKGYQLLYPPTTRRRGSNQYFKRYADILKQKVCRGMLYLFIGLVVNSEILSPHTNGWFKEKEISKVQ